MSRYRGSIGPAGMGGVTALRGASSLIQSIQFGTIRPGTNATATATIASVNTANSVLMYLGRSGGTNDPLQSQTRITLTNATTVTLTKGDASDASVEASFVVVEFAPGVLRSVQYGTATPDTASTTGTKTIERVNTAKAVVIPLGSSHNTGGMQLPQYWALRVALTDATTVTVTRESTTGAQQPTGSFVVVEWF